ncbi:hypothetical protein [Serratia phage X20]|uniref:Uncharacterized protein n=1 Tax=Serratia phage X20 TaxID=2006942 RepID=A0A1Z1LZA8_9CAUD|nr:hypothetical protein KNT72_gp207 [Serratia phage X20]ARW58181.1 hypothetical protein [Serratia phage X20]
MMTQPWPVLVWPKVIIPNKSGFALGEISMMTVPGSIIHKSNIVLHLILEAKRRAESGNRA